MTITLWPVAHVDAVWSQLSDGFHRALMRTGGDINTGDLWQQCRSGAAFLVIAHDEGVYGASIWRPERWETGGKLRCLALYGKNMKTWIEPMHEIVQRIAKDCGANALVAEGRVGWPKIFPKARILRITYEERL